MSVPERSTRQNGIAGRAVAGAGVGAVAYVLGYLITYLTQSGRIEEQLRGLNFFADLFGGDPIPAWQGVGWVFYNAHFVDTEVPALVGGARSVSLISEADGGSLAWLFVLPPLLLLAAGFFAGRFSGSSDASDGAQSGALVVAGYLPLAVIGAFLFRYSVGDGAAVSPTLVTAVLLAGAVYPALFGGIGGAVSGVFGE
ncbi:transporter [Halorubrum laminariae]|uniref:Transporter n=1 Tax=Halorubrum laminariae TaxID=1433523 RepID=A0ABD6C2B2_9EURY|nr:transporter [Halorubrum laminariae]